MSDRIRVLYVHYGDNWLRGSEIALLNTLDNLDRDRFEPVVWSNCQPLVLQCQQQGIVAYHTQFNTLACGKGSHWNISQWHQLVQEAKHLITSHSIKLIHVNSGAPCQWIATAAKATKTPWLAQLHCDYPLNQRFSLGLHLCPRVICVSQAISHNLLKDGYPTEQLSVIHNGVSTLDHANIEKLKIKQKLGIAPNHFAFMSIGSLIERKGFERLIQAIKFHQDHPTNPHLIIVGDGKLKQNLIELTRTLNISDRVHFVGEQANANQWMHSDVDALISGAHSEAFGLTLAEAAMAQCPIIAPNIGGIPEFIEHQYSGLLYDSNVERDLLFQIHQLLENPSLGYQISQNAYFYAMRHLTVEANTQAIEQIYEQQLQQQPQVSMPLSNNIKPVFRWIKQQVEVLS